MWPLLFFSIATVAIVLERAVFFLYHNLKVDDLKETTTAAVRSENFAGARAFLEGQTRRRVGARVLLALIKRRQSSGPELSERRLEKAAETEASGSIASLESGLNLLTTLASLAPLTGFLGTVTGMIAAFRSIADAVDVNAQIVAGGIYEALITTVFGLCIAIVAMSAHSIFSAVVDRFASNLEGACSDLISEICEAPGHEA